MKKQFVLIMTDTQRWDLVSCYRETGLQTPCIDVLTAGMTNTGTTCGGMQTRTIFGGVL